MERVRGGGQARGAGGRRRGSGDGRERLKVMKIGKLSYTKELAIPSGFRAAIGNSFECRKFIDECIVVPRSDRTANFQLLDGGLLCVAASETERFFEMLFWHVVRYSPDPDSSEVNLTPWFLIETPRLLNKKWVDPPSTVARGFTRLFFDYDVELPMTEQNGLSFETFDRGFFDAAIDKVATSLSTCAKQLFRNEGGGDVSLLIIRDSTRLQLKTISGQPHIKIGVHFVFPDVVLKVGSGALWTAYYNLFRQAVLKVFGTSGPVYQQVKEGVPVFANSVEFDTAVITRSDVKLRSIYMYKVEACPGGGNDSEKLARHMPMCACSGTKKIIAKNKGVYRPTRKVFVGREGNVVVEKMEMADASLENATINDLKRIYEKEYRPACITPPYIQSGEGQCDHWMPMYTTKLKTTTIIEFPGGKKLLYEESKETFQKKRKTLRSNTVFTKKQMYFNERAETKSSVRTLEMAASEFKIRWRSYRLEKNILCKPTHYKELCVAPYRIETGGQMKLALVSPTFHFKDTQSFVNHIAAGLMKDKTLKGVTIGPETDMINPLVTSKMLLLVNHFFFQYNVEPNYITFRTYCRLCPNKILRGLRIEEPPDTTSSAMNTESSSSNKEARHKFMILVSTAQRAAAAVLTASGSTPTLDAFLQSTESQFKSLLAKRGTIKFLATDADAVRRMGKGYFAASTWEHNSNTVRVKVSPRLQVRVPAPNEWVVRDNSNGEPDDACQSLLNLTGIHMSFECWSDNCKSCWRPRGSESAFRIDFDENKLAEDLFFNHDECRGKGKFEPLAPSSILKITPHDLWRLVRAEVIKMYHDNESKAKNLKSSRSLHVT